MKHMKKFLIFALVLCMALTVLPMKASAEKVVEKTDWMPGYVSADGTWLGPIEIDTDVELRIYYECSYSYPWVYVSDGSKRLEADSFDRCTYPDNGYDFDYGCYAKYTLEPGSYSIALTSESAYSGGGAYVIRLTLTYEAHTHSYDSTKTVGPTCSERGYTKYTCSCGDSYKEYYGEKLPHTEAASAEVPATCLKTGRTAGTYCSVCGTTISGRETIPKTDHNYEDNTCTYCDRIIGTCGDDLEWAFEADGKLTITGTGDMYDHEMYGAPWSEMCDKVTSVVLPDSLTSIGAFAFQRTAISKLSIPGSVTKIGEGAFYGCENLSGIVIPNSVSSIGEFAFYCCSGLKKVTLPQSITVLPDGIFSGCTALTAATIPEGVTSIGKHVFSDCAALTKVVLPDGITALPEELFENCTALTTVTLPEDITTIPEKIFSGCSSLTSVTIPDGVTSIGSSAFSGCFALKKISIPAGVTSIGDYAFSGCASLTEIFVPEAVTSIGRQAFSGCTGMTKMIIAGDAPAIGTGAFKNLTTAIHYNNAASGWEKVVTQGYGGSVSWNSEHTYKSVVTDYTCTEQGYTTHSCICGNVVIDSYTEADHRWYSWISKQATEEAEGERTYKCDKCGALRTEEIPKLEHVHRYQSKRTNPTCTEQGYTTYTCPCGDSYTDNYKDPQGHNIVDDYCRRCAKIGKCGSNLTWEYDDVTGTLTISGTGKMYNYQSSGYRPSWEKFSENVFEKVVINEGVTGVGDFVFYTKNFETLVLPESLTSIGKRAFVSNKNLLEVTIPAGVTSGGELSFYNCTGLRKVTVYAPTVFQQMFEGCKNLTEVVLAEGVKTLESSAFARCTSLVSINLPGSLRRMEGTYADQYTTYDYGVFYGCSALKEITIPAGVTHIGPATFMGCTSLKNIYFQCSGCLKKSSYQEDFKGVTANAYYPEDDTSWGSVIKKNWGGKLTWIPYTPCTGHVFGEWIRKTEPTCTKSGYESRSCNNCGYEENKKVNAIGHSWDDGIVTAPTCLEEGYTTVTCAACGESYREMPVIATGHKWDDGTVTAPTCTEKGYTTYTCHCGETYKDHEVDMIDHAWDKGTVTKEPTEEATGTMRYTCTACGKTRDETLPKLEHTHKYTSKTTLPTCTEQGYTTYTCRCGDSYQDNFVDAPGHKWDEGVIITEPTEDAEGQKRITCAVCDETETHAIPKLEHVHKYESVVTAPTCTEKGYTIYTCACGDSYKDNYVDASGHKWDEGKVTKEPTESAEGVRTYTCATCGETRTESIPALDHTHDFVTVVTDPTCTERGYTLHTCACGEEVLTDVIEPLGHKITYTVQTEPTAEAEGVLAGTCERCDHKAKIVLPKLNKDSYTYEVIEEPTAEKPGTGRYTWTTEYGTFSFDVTLEKLPEQPEVVLGDINDDGQVTILDLMRLANHFANGVAINEANADVNGDGQVTILDLMRLANYFAGNATLG